MKFWKLTLLSALAFFAISTIVLYSACTVDPCIDLKCANGGACINGYCSCPTGYEGAQCDQMTNTKFLGTYTGNTSCNALPAIFDTAVIYLDQFPLNMGVVFLSHKNDSLWQNDTLHGTINGGAIVIPDFSKPRYSRHVTVTMRSATQVVLYDEEIHVVGGGINVDTQKTVCTFYGDLLKTK